MVRPQIGHVHTGGAEVTLEQAGDGPCHPRAAPASRVHRRGGSPACDWPAGRGWILVGRCHDLFDHDEAFAYLRRCSQGQNRKLYDICIDFAASRLLPQTGADPRSA